MSILPALSQLKRLTFFGALLMLTSCSQHSTPANEEKPAAAAAKESPPPEAPKQTIAKQRAESAMDQYKRDVANKIYQRNNEHLYQGTPPPLLRSVVVLTITVDSKGDPTRIVVMRSNGMKDLEKRAIESVRRAAPLPLPDRFVMKKGQAEFNETWLFRQDGKFQIRTLAQPQA